MKKKVDFGAEKTEYEWQEAADNFYLTYVPKWFNFLEWVVLLGVFHFLAWQLNNWVLKTIYAVSLFGFWFFLQSYFFNIHIEGVPLIKSERAKRLFSLIMGGIISTGVFILTDNIVSQISGQV